MRERRKTGAEQGRGEETEVPVNKSPKIHAESPEEKVLTSKKLGEPPALALSNLQV